MRGRSQRLLLRQRRRGFHVAFTLCLRALGAGARARRLRRYRPDARGRDRVRAAHCAGVAGASIAAERSSWSALAGVTDPEQKRHIIGEEFVRVQERIIESRHLLDEHWILGQGTIYPDTIESGGTAKAAVIKTHHNRVAGIQKLIESGPHRGAAEVVLQGRGARDRRANSGLPAELLDRHPFPGPGLAIRCLCSEFDAPSSARQDGWLVPVHSVGVQGDSRSYAPGAGDRARSIRVRLRCGDGADQPDGRRQSRDRAGGERRAAGGDAGARLFADAGAAGAAAPGGRDRAAALARERVSTSEVWQFPVISDSAGHGGTRRIRWCCARSIRWTA